MKRFITLLLITATVSTPALAGPHSRGGHDAHVGKSRGTPPCLCVQEYESAMQKMHRGMNISYSGDTDVDFVRGMIPHHQGAIDMAHVVLKHGNDEKIKKLARWIIAAQEQEITQMKQWLKLRGHALQAPAGTAHRCGIESKKAMKHCLPAAGSSPSTTEFRDSMDMMHKDMAIKYTGDADVDFVRGMIPHHQGAIDMAKVQLKHGQNRDLNKLADGIIVSQSSEIARMQGWLEDHAQ